MNHAARHQRSARPRPLWVAVVAALWLAAGIVPTASSARSVEAEGGHRCPCGMNCGTVCCCKHKAPGKPKPGKPAAPTPVKVGPCMGTAPCGGAMPPGVSAVAVAVEKADCAPVVAFMPDVRSSALVMAEPHRPRNPVGSPPDEPPEQPIDA